MACRHLAVRSVDPWCSPRLPSQDTMSTPPSDELAELRRRGMATVTASGQLHPRHDLFAQAAIDAVDETTLAELHRDLADQASTGLDKARHLLAAGLPNEAARLRPRPSPTCRRSRHEQTHCSSPRPRRQSPSRRHATPPRRCASPVATAKRSTFSTDCGRRRARRARARPCSLGHHGDDTGSRRHCRRARVPGGRSR